MISIIIYVDNLQNLNYTLDDILNKTPAYDQIIICNDTGKEVIKSGIEFINGNKEGKAKLWNKAIKICHSPYLIFLKHPIKVSEGWIDKLTTLCDPTRIVGTKVNSLDETTWSTDCPLYNKIGFRWDLSIYDRMSSESSISPVVKDTCFIISREFLIQIGGFDDGMVYGDGETTELCIKTWLYGGEVHVCDAEVSIVEHISMSDGTKYNFTRIAETWFDKYASNWYYYSGASRDLDCGRISSKKSKHDFEWLVSNFLPELLGVYSLRNTAFGRSIAVVCDGPSFDKIDRSYINRHDVIIGVNYVADVLRCDLVVADNVSLVHSLLGKYQPSQIIVPFLFLNSIGEPLCFARDVIDGLLQYDVLSVGSIPLSVNPPLINFGSVVGAAVHCALSLGGSSVTVFGCDNKFVGGKSHMSGLPFLNDGKYLPDNDATRGGFVNGEMCLGVLGRLAQSAGVSLFRMNYA